MSSPVSAHPGDGLKTTALPVSRAPEIMPMARASGKLNGAMTANTPWGFSTLLAVSFATSSYIARA